jgi:hypothetical protein
MVDRKVVRFPAGKVRPKPDPFNTETVTKMYADCRRYGRPYPLSVFYSEDLDADADDGLRSGSSSSSSSSEE